MTRAPGITTPAHFGPTSQFYFSQRLRLHYVEWGNPDAPPLLLIHGGRDHCRNWDWLAQKFRDRYHVIAVDLRGHGDSAWATGSSYAIAEFVYDIAQLVQQKNLKPVTIIGHSMGGAISLLYTGSYPEAVAKLVVIEGVFWTPAHYEARDKKPITERMTRWIENLRDLSGRNARKYASVEEATARMAAENKRLTAEQAAHLTIHGVNQNEDGTFSWKYDNYIRTQSPFNLPLRDIRALWGNISCPTLLIKGAESEANDAAADGTLAFFKNAKAVTISGAGHWVHHDKLDEFATLLGTFLK
jgi:pimeloyl-ACP methyl ester carboxylesterase